MSEGDKEKGEKAGYICKCSFMTTADLTNERSKKKKLKVLTQRKHPDEDETV